MCWSLFGRQLLVWMLASSFTGQVFMIHKQVLVICWTCVGVLVIYVSQASVLTLLLVILLSCFPCPPLPNNIGSQASIAKSRV